MIRIVPYERVYQPDFKRLNLEWLDKHQITEQYDLDVLNDPEKNILAHGGVLFVALDGEKVVGTAGLQNKNDGIVELIKMAVDPEMRGRGVGKMLLLHCVSEARRMNAHLIRLFSNSKLTTAISMYEKFGFRHIPVTDSHLETADVKMELSLTQ